MKTITFQARSTPVATHKTIQKFAKENNLSVAQLLKVLGYLCMNEPEMVRELAR